MEITNKSNALIQPNLQSIYYLNSKGTSNINKLQVVSKYKQHKNEMKRIKNPSQSRDFKSHDEMSRTISSIRVKNKRAKIEINRKLLDHNQVKHQRNRSTHINGDSKVQTLTNSISVSQIEKSPNIWLAKSRPCSQMMNQTIDGSFKVNIGRKKNSKLGINRPRTSINILHMMAQNNPESSRNSSKNAISQHTAPAGLKPSHKIK